MRQIEINADKKQSLIHLGSLDSFDITEGGKKAGRRILDYLETKEKDILAEIIDIYESLIPNENFGGEYTALEWLCKLWGAPEEEQERLLSNPQVRGFYELLSENDFYNLKWYINRKYHFIEIDRKDLEAKAQLRFLEDFILFANPDRERWEKIRENLEQLPLKKGMHVADVGCGPGCYTFKFADLVGEEGRVYAIESNPKHLEYLQNYVQKNNIHNVEIVAGKDDGIGIDASVRVDMVYICSLYHIVYSAFSDAERDSFIESIRTALNPGGYLVVVDNDLVENNELPYHGPYIARELLLSQIYYYGFTLEKEYQFTPQRYILLLKKQEEKPASDPVSHAHFADREHHKIQVTSSSSLVRYRIIGTQTSGFTWNGKRMAILLEQGLRENRADLVAEAAAEYEKWMRVERIGDEYTALLWFCQMYLKTEEEREEILKDPLFRIYYNFFAGNHYEILTSYLRSKYDLKQPLPECETEGTLETTDPELSFGVLNDYSEYLTFNNPNRYLWEDTEAMLSYMDIRPGETVADIGCGSGYFSWRFSNLVGPDGIVYATEINDDALSYVRDLNKETDTRIVPKLAKMNATGLDDNSVDTMFLCSMYHATYIASIDFVKDEFVKSMRKALKPDGRLYIVDNDIAPVGEPAYFGPGIVKELVISQLENYGFVLEDMRQFVPQRYVLKFRNSGVPEEEDEEEPKSRRGMPERESPGLA